jgi:hypothetical protein
VPCGLTLGVPDVGAVAGAGIRRPVTRSHRVRPATHVLVVECEVEHVGICGDLSTGADLGQDDQALCRAQGISTWQTICRTPWRVSTAQDHRACGLWPAGLYASTRSPFGAELEHIAADAQL